MRPQALLSGRMAELREAIEASLSDAATVSLGFIARLEGAASTFVGVPKTSIEQVLASAKYEGVPGLARAGYVLAAADDKGFAEHAPAFLAEVERVRGRPGAVSGEILKDDIALLGIADGLARAADRPEAATAKEWLAAAADAQGSSGHWTYRARLLAADLMDGMGRLRAAVPEEDVDAAALELCLRRTWPLATRLSPPPSDESRFATTTKLLGESTPLTGELERAAVWLLALGALIGEAAASLVPTADAVVAILRATQGSFKRWPWEEAGSRHRRSARWLIDSEAHVQALLYAILYPHFGASLTDERYVDSSGTVQPRIDFGIRDLKLVIEVKVVRNWSDAKKIEAEVREDCGHYFEEPDKWERMVVYVYDDADRSEPERWYSLRDALMRFDRRIVEVVIVQRPSCLPPRAERKTDTK